MKHMFYHFYMRECSVYALCTDSILTTNFEAEMGFRASSLSCYNLTLLLQSCQFIFLGFFRLNYGHLRFLKRERVSTSKSIAWSLKVLTLFSLTNSSFSVEISAHRMHAPTALANDTGCIFCSLSHALSFFQHSQKRPLRGLIACSGSQLTNAKSNMDFRGHSTTL